MQVRLLCDWNGMRRGQCFSADLGKGRRLIETRVAERYEPDMMPLGLAEAGKAAKGTPKRARDKMQRGSKGKKKRTRG